MATFVIVHGGFGGGWEWTPVARLLRGLGHDVFVPTLTGMGERAHLGRREPARLATHVEDVVALLEVERLEGVVLCGASYGGMPVTGAADRAPRRVALVVYLDALVPRDGQSALDLLPAAWGETVRAGEAEHGATWRVPVPASALPPEGWVPQDVRARYVERLRPQPVATFTDAIRLSGAVERLPRAFVRCVGAELGGEFADDPIAPIAERARAAGWPYRELAAPHDPHLADPEGTAWVLDELASSQVEASP